jgi:23S rRNA (cytosine1962-C5)-methyltransferase
VGADPAERNIAVARAHAEQSGVAVDYRCTTAEDLAVAGETFDIVLADPPPFVKSRKDLEPGAKAYRKLARLAAEVTAPEGLLLLASCSHNIPPERFAAECAQGIQRTGRRATLIRQAGAGPDHPVHPLLPESAYLKALVYALD